VLSGGSRRMGLPRRSGCGASGEAGHHWWPPAQGGRGRGEGAGAAGASCPEGVKGQLRGGGGSWGEGGNGVKRWVCHQARPLAEMQGWEGGEAHSSHCVGTPAG
jgi:hypothetical protein